MSSLTPFFRLGICFLLFVGVAHGYNEHCYEMVAQVLDGQLGHMVPCIKELGLDTPKTRAENYNCIMRCVLIKAKTLTSEGKISVMQAIAFILEQVGNEFLEKALTEIAKCQEFAHVIVGDQAGCIGMRPLIACGVDFVFRLCK